jgi:pSer/pThr/pTyr-binding forkhead associated (FHA) protein
MGHQPSSQGVLLLVIEGEIQPDAIYPLSNDQEILIGRDSSCDIPLDFDDNISRRHASIRPLAGGGWEIVDHNSANGTYINGHRLPGAQVLHPGDRLIFSQGGPEFVFEYQVPVGIAIEESQPKAVAPRQTIETKQYRLEILPRQLIIQRKGVWFYRSSLIGLVIFLIFFFPFVPIVLLIILIQTFFPKVISYQFDLDSEKLIITSQSLFNKLFNRFRYQSYPLEEITAVRLQKSVYKGDEGTRYDNYHLELVLKKNNILKLDFQWRVNYRSLSNSEQTQIITEATELVDWIQKYLEHE